ncbi:flagellar protein FlaG [uncultured Propionivibrio sp.]|uniref:flagellar protein FlaG n=1 Tax=uncultured Propionivibrio sp. TaxID=426737 RepID=UPI0029C0BF4D|nr:flagellar protein FlaG [uncultured Propionivibrio sp.]
MNIQSISNNVLTSTTQARQQYAAQSSAGAARAPGEAEQVTQAQSPAEQQAHSAENLSSAVKAVNDFVSSVNSDLKFSVDNDTGKTIVKVVDKNTDEVIRQVPSEEMMAIAKALDSIKGLLVKQKA